MGVGQKMLDLQDARISRGLYPAKWAYRNRFCGVFLRSENKGN